MDVVRIVRNVFLRCFVIGVGLGLLSAIVAIGGWDVWTPLAIRLFHTDSAALTAITLRFFTELRFFLYFCLLTPGLALHWTLKAEAKRTH